MRQYVANCVSFTLRSSFATLDQLMESVPLNWRLVRFSRVEQVGEFDGASATMVHAEKAYSEAGYFRARHSGCGVGSGFCGRVERQRKSV